MTLTKEDGATRLLQVLYSSFNFKTHYEDSKHKSEICRAAFQTSSQCKFKNDCDFAHDIRELRPRVFDFSNFKRQKCCNWATGCQYSTRCLYLHDEESYEIDTGMILLHSKRERKFRIVRDQGDGTVCVFTLHSDGKPKDSLGKTVINSLWSFTKGRYNDIKLPAGVKIPIKVQKPKREIRTKPVCTPTCCPPPESLKKTTISAKLVPIKDFCKPVDNVYQQPELTQVKQVNPVIVGYTSSPSPPMNAVVLPAPLRQFTAHRVPPGFSAEATVTHPPTSTQPLYMEPISLPENTRISNGMPSPPTARQISMTSQPPSTLDHNAPPYVPGEQWTPTRQHFQFNSAPPTFKPTTYSTSPVLTPYNPYPPTYVARDASPPTATTMTFAHSPSPPFYPYSPAYYSIAEPTGYGFPAPGTSIVVPNTREGEVPYSAPPELPPSGVLMPPAMSYSPVTTPTKKEMWDPDQVDQKEESPMVSSMMSPRSHTSSVSHSHKGSSIRGKSPSAHTEEHKSPERPVKEGVFDPHLIKVDETKELLKIIGDYQKALGSQENQIKELRVENRRLRKTHENRV